VLVDVGVVSREDLTRGRMIQASRHELVDTLRTFATSLAALQASVLILIDQAHTLPLDSFEQLDALTGFDGAARVVQLVLVGEPELLEILGRSELKPLARRLGLHLELGPPEPDASSNVIDQELVETAAAEMDPARSAVSPHGLVRGAAAVVMLAMLMLAGAAGAAFVFKEHVSRIVVQWQAIPQPPGPPAPRVPAPLTPIAEPPS
jgi:hypothetical protein